MEKKVQWGVAPCILTPDRNQYSRLEEASRASTSPATITKKSDTNRWIFEYRKCMSEKTQYYRLCNPWKVALHEESLFVHRNTVVCFFIDFPTLLSKHLNHTTWSTLIDERQDTEENLSLKKSNPPPEKKRERVQDDLLEPFFKRYEHIRPTNFSKSGSRGILVISVIHQIWVEKNWKLRSLCFWCISDMV